MGHDRLSSLHTIEEYLEGIEQLGFAIKTRRLVRDFALYRDGEELLAELSQWPVELSIEEKESIAQRAVERSLPGIDAGAVNFPFKVIILELMRS